MSDRLSNIIYIAVPDDLDRQIGSFHIDPTVMLPVEASSGGERWDIHDLAWEQIIAAMLKIMAYDPGTIEPRWQEYWRDHSTFRAEDGGDKPKYYVLDMFPYPSGNGLHVGHPEGYTATDIVCRWKRMNGFTYPPSPDEGRPPARRPKQTFMERMEERWRRRQEER